MSAFDNPPRMSLTNMVTGETNTAQYNPEKLEESLSSSWARLSPPGMSHQVLQFTCTENQKYSIELFLVANTTQDALRMQITRRFILSLLVPVGGAATVVGGGPPRVLFVWPRTLSVTSVITSAKFSHELFKRNGQTRVMKISLDLEEIRDARVTSDEILRDTSSRYGAVSNGQSALNRMDRNPYLR
jgi:hypothetical protein